jgi:VWFA-related protein
MGLAWGPLFSLAVVAASAAFAQDAPPVFRTTSDLVVVDVQVIHNKMKTAAPALRKEDFQIFEDGVAQEIAFFGMDELPLSIVLMFDVTDTVRPEIRRLSQNALEAFRHLNPKDEVAVMICHSTAVLVDGFTTDRVRTMHAIADAAARKSREAAFFNEDVYRAAEQAGKATNPTSRRVAIWFTDGLPNMPTERMRRRFGKSVAEGELHTEAQAIRMLHESGSVVTPVILKSSISDAAYVVDMLFSGPPSKSNPPGNPRKYAEVTGGEVFQARGKDASDRLAEAIDGLRSRYAIGFRPREEKPAGTYCKLRVALAPGTPLRAQEWNVLARDGYYRK